MDSTGFLFLTIAAVFFSIVGIGLISGRTLGIAFRSRFIARREHEPVLYWASLTIFGASGALLTYAVVSVVLD